MKVKFCLNSTERTVKALWLPACLSIAYFLFMLRFYLIDFYVPDFRLYASFAQQGLPAKDGFSSLFLFMAGLSSFMPRFMTVLCLVMLTVSIFTICWFCYRRLWVNIGLYCLMVLSVFMCGSWFYFYGKVFYDFPFSVFNFAIALITFSNYADLKENNKLWYVSCALFGLTLSWKAYNIFMIAGFGILCFCYDETRKILVNRLLHVKQLALSLVTFILGYLIGNYNFIVDPIGTLQGIRGYEAQSSVMDFFFTKDTLHWDHVNDMPFNVSVYFVPCMFLLSFLIPLFIRKIRYMVSSMFLLLCLCVFIRFFSGGYTWHGFTFGVYLCLLFCFLLKEGFTLQKKRAFNIVTIFILAVQFIMLAGFYIPKQVQWYVVTEESLEVLKIESSDIYMDVLNMISENGIYDCSIESAVYRYKPVATGPIVFKRLSRHNLYIVPENIYYGSALEIGDYLSWKSISDNQSDSADYLVWIIPNAFKTMSDVANIHLYDNNELINSVVRSDYSIYLYRK